MEIILYTRNQCPLCEDAKGILLALQHEYSFTLLEKDIETNDEWTEQFGLMIPVVEIDGEVIQNGMVDIITLEERINRE